MSHFKLLVVQAFVLGFFYAKSNAKTIHLFNIDREDFKRGYIETNEDGEIKQRKFKEDMMLLNLRLHRAIETDDINYVQLSANGYPQGVHWERNIKNRGRERAEQDAFIVHFNCTVGWSNIDEMHAMDCRTLITINAKFGICFVTICGEEKFQKE